MQDLKKQLKSLKKIKLDEGDWTIAQLEDQHETYINKYEDSRDSRAEVIYENN